MYQWVCSVVVILCSVALLHANKVTAETNVRDAQTIRAGHCSTLLGLKEDPEGSLIPDRSSVATLNCEGLSLAGELDASLGDFYSLKHL